MTVLESLFAAWNEHEVEAGVELFADEMVYRDQAHGSKEALTANMHSAFAAMPDVKFQLTSSFQQGRHFAGEVTMTGTRPSGTGDPTAAGDQFTVLHGVVGDLNDERQITRLVECWNPAGFTGQGDGL